MGNGIRKVTLLVLLVSGWFGYGHAQVDLTWKGSGGWGPGSNYSKLFNPNTIETITGEVVSIDTIVPVKGMFKGVSIIVQTSDGNRIPAHLGPQWYLEFQDAQIRMGDRVVVSGSRVTFEDRPVIIATEVLIRGKEMLRLRDKNGRPSWSALQPQ